jgi:N-acetyl-gamma-glutamyl-phosphate/LysW-gamma-L-alpha-aminoadipyl-6-phosphate reductase
MSEVRVSIVGAAGYTGGEALRILLGHSRVTVAQVTSESKRGQFVHSVHPNLRKITSLTFAGRDEIQPCDVLFLCLPHGEAAQTIDRYLGLAPVIVDLSADFRLRDAALYERWYGHPHARPELLGSFIYGMPELHRDELRGATRISGTGCLATAAILGLAPLAASGLVEAGPVVIEGKMGSSAGGVTAGPDSHHPERSGAMRSFAPVGHRHTAELVQELHFPAAASDTQRPGIHLSATAVEAVRGVLMTAHLFLREDIEEKRIWQVYREAYGKEPFIRQVRERQGLYRLPEPKILSGSNFCDIGFALDREGGRVVVIAALDNLVKGAAGNAVQCLNIAQGWPETEGLSFPGLHP